MLLSYYIQCIDRDLGGQSSRSAPPLRQGPRSEGGITAGQITSSAPIYQSHPSLLPTPNGLRACACLVTPAEPRQGGSADSRAGSTAPPRPSRRDKRRGR